MAQHFSPITRSLEASFRFTIETLDSKFERQEAKSGQFQNTLRELPGISLPCHPFQEAHGILIIPAGREASIKYLAFEGFVGTCYRLCHLVHPK